MVNWLVDLGLQKAGVDKQLGDQREEVKRLRKAMAGLSTDNQELRNKVTALTLDEEVVKDQRDRAEAKLGILRQRVKTQTLSLKRAGKAKRTALSDHKEQLAAIVEDRRAIVEALKSLRRVGLLVDEELAQPRDTAASHHLGQIMKEILSAMDGHDPTTEVFNSKHQFLPNCEVDDYYNSPTLRVQSDLMIQNDGVKAEDGGLDSCWSALPNELWVEISRYVSYQQMITMSKVFPSLHHERTRRIAVHDYPLQKWRINHGFTEVAEAGLEHWGTGLSDFLTATGQDHSIDRVVQSFDSLNIARFQVRFEAAGPRYQEIDVKYEDDGFLVVDCGCIGGYALGPCPHLSIFLAQLPEQLKSRPFRRLADKYWRPTGLNAHRLDFFNRAQEASRRYVKLN
jgi:hypothetical protein